jgi:tetraacyldisaccharide 4'-kinase
MRYFCTFLTVPVSGAVLIRRRLYRGGLMPVHRLRARVISIGNISIGGTGKTPAVRLVAEHLMARGEKVVILTRGYGRTTFQKKILVGGKCRWKEVGDEALMLSRFLPAVPIVVGKDRVSSGRLAVEKLRPRFVILDDGLQYLRLARDVEMVIIDATCPFGNGRLFPGGILREHIGALRRAHLFFVTKVNQAENVGDLVDFLRRTYPHAPVVQGTYQPSSLRDVCSHDQLGLKFLRGKPVVAMSGIGNHTSFERSLEQIGARLAEKVRLPDHHRYRQEEVFAAARLARKVGAQYVVTTEKDEVRLPAMERAAVPLLSLGIQLQVVSGEEQLWDFLERGL